MGARQIRDGDRDRGVFAAREAGVFEGHGAHRGRGGFDPQATARHEQCGEEAQQVADYVSKNAGK